MKKFTILNKSANSTYKTLNTIQRLIKYSKFHNMTKSEQDVVIADLDILIEKIESFELVQEKQLFAKYPMFLSEIRSLTTLLFAMCNLHNMYNNKKIYYSFEKLIWSEKKNKSFNRLYVTKQIFKSILDYKKQKTKSYEEKLLNSTKTHEGKK